jgi:tetratricopeptide (TPR) repeat protein
MKRTILTGLVAIGAGATCLMAQAPPPATPAAPGQMPVAKQMKAKSKSELEAWNALVAAVNDPDKAIAAAENLITKYTDSDFTSTALNIEADAWQKKGDFNKMEIYADRVLEVNPMDSQALLMLAKHYATHTRENDLDREEKLGKAEKYANLLIEVAKTLPKPSAQFTDEQWAAARKDTAAEAYNVIGQANLTRKKYDAAAAGFKSAVDSASAPEPAYMVRLALALQSGGKYDEAIEWCDKAAAVPNVHPQVKAVAAQIKAQAVKAAAAAKAPAPPPPAK